MLTKRISALAFLTVVAACSRTSTTPVLPTGIESSAFLSAAADKNDTTLTYFDTAPATFPWSIVNAPDGALYVSEWGSNGNDGGIARLGADGLTQVADIAPAGSTPILGAFDPLGNLWFSNGGGFFSSQADAFSNLSPNGTIATYSLNYGHEARPRFSTFGRDGNIWYALTSINEVDRVAQDGSVSRFSLPATAAGPARPNDIITGPDGDLWVTEWIGNAIARLNLDGTVAQTFPLTQEASPRFLTAGVDGNIWFSENGSAFFTGNSYTPPQIVRMSPTGQMTAFPMPSALSAPDSIRAAANDLVFTDLGMNAVGVIGYDGSVVEYPLPITGTVGIQFAIEGADGSLYFSDDDQNRVGRIVLGKKGVIFPKTVALSSGASQLVGVAVAGDRGPYTATTDNPAIARVNPIAGFPMNFTVTAIAPGSTALTIKGKGKALTAPVVVSQAALQANVRAAHRPIAPE